MKNYKFFVFVLFIAVLFSAYYTSKQAVIYETSTNGSSVMRHETSSLSVPISNQAELPMM